MPADASLTCPDCNYDLRSHPAPNRCPECGFTYETPFTIWRLPKRNAGRAIFIGLACAWFNIAMFSLTGNLIVPMLPRYAPPLILLCVTGVAVMITWMIMPRRMILLDQHGIHVRLGRKRHDLPWPDYGGFSDWPDGKDRIRRTGRDAGELPIYLVVPPEELRAFRRTVEELKATYATSTPAPADPKIQLD